jgi:hypothetical protein
MYIGLNPKCDASELEKIVETVAPLPPKYEFPMNDSKNN